jgi:hypothetical protein
MSHLLVPSLGMYPAGDSVARACQLQQQFTTGLTERECSGHMDEHRSPDLQSATPTRGAMKRRRIPGPLAIAGAIAGTAPATVAAAPSDPPGCFGQAVSADRPAPERNAFGNEVSATGQDNVPFGTQIVPLFRSDACG